MGITVALHHTTRYRYDRPISLGMQTIRLRPAPHTKNHVQSYSLEVRPANHFINWQQDPFGNYLARVVFPEKLREFEVTVDLITEIRVFNPFDFFLEDSAMDFPFAYEASLAEELVPYLETKESGPLLEQFLQKVNRSKRGTVQFLVDLNQQVYQSLTYLLRMEPGVQTCEVTLSHKSGSCRDMAWLMCQLLRHLGLASRFASGYLIQLAQDEKSLDGPFGPEKDFTDLHAWCEVYLPGAGWIGLDPTSGLFTGEGHIPLCCTPNPSSAAPISGTHEPADANLYHNMRLTRVVEPPRVTKPYTDHVWEQIDALGEKIDEDLAIRDVRLTMGGEPTFVSLDDRSGEEWHFTALSEKKTELGKIMFSRLCARFAPGCLQQYTQGKWYPGEILPRWAMNAYWRTDKEPVWQNQALLADPTQPQNHTLHSAKTFLDHLATSLGIPAEYVLPAREDTAYYLWKERRLPIEGDILKADTYEKTERERLQRLMDQNLKKEVGYVLPLSFSPTRNGWISNRWQFANGHLMLLPGDSPVGLRLPLASLPFVPEAEKEAWPDRSNFAQLTALPVRSGFLSRPSTVAAASYAKDANGLVKSAVVAEVRGELLHIFLPPLSYVEHFLELIAIIEDAATALNIPIVLEGYAPPRDVRLRHFSVTPDPGVLEINVPPAASWDELKTITSAVYEEARNSRLTAEKFQMDGRSVSTGGGNHIVLGAATPADSPFLRRPGLLRSMLTFWQNHPALSYLFAGLYIGPTSQAPRIDEARSDSLYELDIAFRQINDDETAPAWLVDRLFRNILVDLTGNTHRAEFCIDKLYSPDSERGRLGLLEMRGFEMSPHPQMNLVQALLLRAIVAHFWKTPYRGSLIHLGTALHDQYMLPHYLREDMQDLLQTLKSGGYDLQPHWFEPFFAFRFPEYGSVQLGGITLSLRLALEPWPVLGEEMGRGGVSRSVDSSLERVQVLVSGINPTRHAVTCNNIRVPLHPTRENGTYVAGVRYKAWAPPSSLHPNIKPHTPLVFDVVDMQLNRSLGGCRYHVSHPGGRSYDVWPVNQNEAEGRMMSRFEPMGHSSGHRPAPPLVQNPDFPHTLDLRLFPNINRE